MDIGGTRYYGYIITIILALLHKGSMKDLTDGVLRNLNLLLRIGCRLPENSWSINKDFNRLGYKAIVLQLSSQRS
jgi:hypothetical protein